MSESNNNPLNDFLNGMETGTETENNLFAEWPLSKLEESMTQLSEPVPEAPKPVSLATPAQESPINEPSLFAEALAQTPAAQQQEAEDPFTEALKKAKAQSEERLADSLAEKEAIFAYGKAKDPISEHDCTFEELRQKYGTDFPELSESKKVSWTVSYGKVTKSIGNPGSDKVYDIKTEIEKSKSFLDGVKNAKTDAEKQPECLVKPRVTAQSKGKTFRMPSYKEYCVSAEEAEASTKSIVMLPSRSGKIYEMRKTPVGTFTAPAELLPEFPEVQSGFQMAFPKIPMHILLFIINFFEKLSDRFELEALVHILYDTVHHKYTIRVPQQELTHTSVHSVMEEEYPEHLIHVMDIHSHNTMQAKFSPIDDEDEKATRLYAVVGRLDKVFPDIALRASCAGKFIPVRPEEIFETNFKAYPYPSIWNEKITIKNESIVPQQLVRNAAFVCKECVKNEIL